MNFFDSLSKFYKKNKDVIILTSIFIICALVFSYRYFADIKPTAENSQYNSYITGNADGVLNEMLPTMDIKQKFVMSGDISGISIKFGTYARENNGYMKISLKDIKANELIKEWTFDISDIKDNEYQELALDNNLLGLDKNEYEFDIRTYDTDVDHSITIYSVNGEKEDWQLTINGEVQNKNISIATKSLDSNFLKPVYIVATIILTVFLMGLYYLIFIKKFKIEKVFAFAAAILGIGYMFLNTPYSNFDEPSHFQTAYKYSNCLLGIGNGENGLMLRRADDTMAGLDNAYTSISTYKTVYDNLFSFVENDQLVELGGRRVHEVPYLYIPTTFGVTIARICYLGQIPTLMLGRLINLIAYIALVYYAIKKMPFAKIIICMIALLPMPLSLAASYSYDGMINGIAFLFTAYCLHFAFNKEEKSKKEHILFAIFTILLAPIKIVYVMVCGLCLIIPRKNFKNNKQFYKLVLGILACAVISFVVFSLQRMIGSATSPSDTASVSGTAAFSLGDIINYPGHFIRLFVNTIDVAGFSFIFNAISGVYLVNINNLYTLVFIILLILSAFKEENEEMYITSLNKLLMFLIVFGLYCVLSIVSYTWTSIDKTSIEGLQGRYMLPVFPMILLLIRNKNLCYKKDISNVLIFVLGITQSLALVHAFISII